MCLAVAGQILTIACPMPAAGGEEALWRMAEVDFGGVRQQVSLACLPQAQVGDQVLVHVGFALSVVDDDPETVP